VSYEQLFMFYQMLMSQYTKHFVSKPTAQLWLGLEVMGSSPLPEEMS